MKYTYAYKTSDGVRHEDSMNASSREEVFDALRAKGIRAIKVVAADGSKANGEVRGVRKRVVIAAIAVAAVAAGSLVYFLTSRGKVKDTAAESVAVAPQGDAPSEFREARPLPRQMISGDRTRIESAAASLSSPAERLLAAFAEPGRPVAPVTGPRPSDADFEASLREPTRVSDKEFTEAVDLKRIVARIKSDMRVYLSDGGTIDGYLDELAKRQKLEVSYREKAERNLARLLTPESLKQRGKAEAYEYWLKANAQLQSMGIYPLPLPYVLRDYEATLDID